MSIDREKVKSKTFGILDVDYPSESWKWDPDTGGDFLEAARKLTSGEQWGYSQDWYWEPIAPWIWENGGDWYDSEITKSTMADAKTLGGVQFLADLLLKHQVSPTPAQMAGRDAPTLYRNGFKYFQMGYASALAWVLFVIVLSFTLLQFRFSKRWVYYETDIGI